MYLIPPDFFHLQPAITCTLRIKSKNGTYKRVVEHLLTVHRQKSEKLSTTPLTESEEGIQMIQFPMLTTKPFKSLTLCPESLLLECQKQRKHSSATDFLGPSLTHP